MLRHFLMLTILLCAGCCSRTEVTSDATTDAETTETSSTVFIESTPSDSTAVTQSTPSTQRTSTESRTTTDGATAASPDDSYCWCSANSLWVDVVFITDSSNAMGEDGLAAVTAMLQSTLAQMTLDPAQKMYSRAAAVVYAKYAKTVRDFSNLVTVSDIINLDLPFIGGREVNITDAFDEALDIFDDFANTNRKNVRRVIALTASAYRNDDYKIVDEFKAEGGIVVVIDFVQEGEKPNPELKQIASPGYFFSNQEESFDFHDLLQAFCDANCFCRNGHTTYSFGNERKIANGGCYNTINLEAIQPAAAKACTKEGGYLATIHNKAKQFFMMQLFPTKSQYWIGYQRVDGGYVWDDNTTDWFDMWQTGQPKFNSGDCVYACQYSGFNSAWYSDACFTAAHNYPCQFRPCDSTHNCFP